MSNTMAVWSIAVPALVCFVAHTWHCKRWGLLLGTVATVVLFLASQELWQTLAIHDYIYPSTTLQTARLVSDQDVVLVREAADTPTTLPAVPQAPLAFAAHEGVDYLGVAHTRTAFLTEGKQLLDAIDAHDALYLEYGTGYFDVLARYAERHGKTVRYIDSPHRSTLFTVLDWGVFPLLSLGALALAWTQQSRWRVSLALALSVWMLLSAFPDVGFWAMARTGSYAPIAWASTSYVTDGRTLAMQDRIQALHQARPEERPLVLTGGLHTQGFAYYWGHPVLAQIKRMVDAPWMGLDGRQGLPRLSTWDRQEHGMSP